MNIAICDDENLSLNRIKNIAQNYFTSKEIKANISTFQSAQELLKSNISDYNILLLDVNMNDLNGIEAAKIIRKTNKNVYIVYISALIEYAIMGYSVKAFDYLLKDDLTKSFPKCMDDILEQMKVQNEKISLKTNIGEINIPLSNIVYFESENHKVFARLINSDLPDFYSYGKLADYERMIEAKGFLRIHKSYLVNMKNVQAIKCRTAYLVDGSQLNCSKETYKLIVQKFALWRGEH